MREQVTVTAVLDEEFITVSCSSGACSGCKGSGFCNTKSRTFTAWNKDHLPLIVGDTVSLYLPTARTIGATLITLIIPLLFFPLCYYLASFFGLGEGLSFLVALGGIGIGFGLVRIFFRSREKKYMPLVVDPTT
ncbi:MAG TPA: SoxR reducing system RseC family protein [Sphaerochaeta sp.]|nr:SoxR reducing system RseC family protein [Sphaerochaeta sp.]